MAEEVDIGNVGGEAGVASEVTLCRLIVAMDKMAKANGINSPKYLFYPRHVTGMVPL